MAEKFGSLRIVPRFASSSWSICMLSKWVHMSLLLTQHVSCSFFHSSIVIMCNCLLKSAFNASQASFTVGFSLIFKYKELRIVDAICWKTIACSCEYWLISLTYFLIVLTCFAVKAVDPAGLSGGVSGLATVPSKWLYNPQAQIESSSLSFHTMKPFPSAGSLGTWRKLLPSFKLSDIHNK